MIMSLNWLLVVSCLLLFVGAVGYRHQRHTVASGTVPAAGGFAVLAVLWVLLAIRYLTESGSATFLAAVSIVALFLCLHAVRLVVSDWQRAPQITTVTAAILLVALPFELYPALRVGVRELLTAQLASIVGLLGHQPSIQQAAGGGLTKLVFENGSYLVVTPECTGIGAVALFSGLVIGTRTTTRRKLVGLGTVVIAVYSLNMLRISFVAAAMANNWFAPLLGRPDSLQTTYYVAEIAIGQTFVIGATVAYFLLLSRWLPDMRQLIDDVVASI